MKESSDEDEDDEEEGKEDGDEEEENEQEVSKVNGSQSSNESSPTDSRSSGSRGTKNKRGNQELNLCEEVLLGLQKHEDAWPFRHPVDLKKVPDYTKVIHRPMDFDTVQKKLQTMNYEDAWQFIEDVKLVFENCKIYNDESDDVYACGQRMQEHFKELLLKILPELGKMLAEE